MAERPIPLPLRVDGIPERLKHEPRWCLWKYEEKVPGSGKWTKVPVNARTYGHAQNNNPQTWCDYSTALDALLMSTGLAGIGFMLGDGWVGVDLDDCYSFLDGFTELAESVLSSVQGYAEISPSGNGVKVILNGTIPQSKADHKLGLELYNATRFFAVTGHALPGRDNTIPEHSIDLAPLYVRYFGAYALENGGRSVSNGVNDHADPLVNAKGPLAGWDIERTEIDLLSFLDADCSYQAWIEVGQALHHQGQGDDDWCELWDSWSSRAEHRYQDGLCEEKWLTFSEQRAQGKGPVTLATLIKRARTAQSQEKYDRVDHWRMQISSTQDRLQLMEELPRLIARDLLVDGVVREELAQVLQQRIKEVTKTRHPIATVRAWLTPVIDEEEDLGPAPDWVTEHVYVTDDDAFFSLDTKGKLSRTAFNATYNRRMPKDDQGHPIEKAADAATDRWNIRLVQRIGYHPLLDAIYESAGDLYVNAYRADQVPVVPPVLLDEEEQAIERVKQHIANLLTDPREQQLFTSWLAFVVQNPGVKVRWAPYICGPEGDGKSFFGTLLGLVMGARNVRVLNGKIFESSQFTDWAVGQCVTIVEEMKLHGHNKFDATNAIKPFITNDTISVHPKGKPAYTAINTTQYAILSNYLDGVPITDSDRRFCFMRSRFSVASLQQFKDENPDYYERLFDGVQTYPGALRYWLLNFSDFHPDFSANGKAPSTAMRGLVIDMSQSDVDAACQDVVREGGPGVTASWVASAAFVDAVAAKLGPSTTLSRQKLAGIASQYLADHGYIRMGGEKHRIGPNRIESRFWRHETAPAPEGDWWGSVSAIIEASFSDAVSQGFLD